MYMCVSAMPWVELKAPDSSLETKPTFAVTYLKVSTIYTHYSGLHKINSQAKWNLLLKVEGYIKKYLLIVSCIVPTFKKPYCIL